MFSLAIFLIKQFIFFYLGWQISFLFLVLIFNIFIKVVDEVLRFVPKEIEIIDVIAYPNTEISITINA